MAKGKSPAKGEVSVDHLIGVDRLVEATAERFQRAPAPDGGEPNVVGAPTFPNIEKLIAPTIKSLIKLAVEYGGERVEDMASAQAELLADFVPDELYRLVEKIAHRLHGGEPHPHVVGEAPDA